jgi:uncharacterized protein YodC (DUF2158 family)
MARAAFVVGDVVRVKGITGPYMVVAGVESQAITCIWFDATKRVQSLILNPTLLEVVPENEREAAMITAL